MSEDLKKKDFLELWEMGMKFFKNARPQWQQRYCVKDQKPVLFSDLKDMECWKCPEYICNKGVCDCI